jgi:hypothetical protein
MNADEHQVLKFRPRTSAHPPSAFRELNGSAENANLHGPALVGRDSAQRDDYRHRMITNAAAIAFTALLTGAGIWLAVKLADLRNTQDCVLMGRRDCAHIAWPKS